MAPNQESLKNGISETTPLLASSSIAPSQDPDIAETLVASPTTDHGADTRSIEEKPLPKAQIFLLCYARLIEPIAFFSIFPYINQMLQVNADLPASDVGFYSGLIESLFSLTQMLVMLFWGKASDRIGRKPVLVFSLVGVAISTGIFGLARNLWQMILFRCLAGVFAGTIVTIRTMISEHSTAKTQARSFSWFAFAGNLGILFGPLVGGALAEPATQYPGAFGDVVFFKEYPYALPSFAVGIIGFTAVLTSALFVEETLKKKPQSSSSGGAENGHANGGNVSKSSSTSIWELMKSPGVAIVLYIYGHVMVLAFAYTAVVPVFWFTPVSLGGFGFTTFQISLFLGLTGFSQAVWLLVFFPPLQHRLGTNGVMRLCAYVYPIAMGFSAILSAILRSGAETTFWVIMPIFVLVAPGISMSFTAVQLALNDVSPSPETLGTLNALALTGTSALRSFSPALFTSIFAIGIRTQILWGYLVWLVVTILAAGFTVAVRYLPAASEKDYPDDGTREAIRQAEAAAAHLEAITHLEGTTDDDEETLRGD
ncbi:putative Major facilitator superfamily domain-containing protein [Seiridium unicorne]|uniref:Major facilitator superfamily domain-containing protein n=1 Tax=Seiridium unicorne TaxID=138068 RepID=A0ABR2VID8_9PEZI